MPTRMPALLLAATMLVPSLASAQTPRPAARSTQAPARPAQAPARPAAAAQQGLQVPSAATMLILIKSTLVALDQANRTNVYHVLYGLGSDRFRASNRPETLAQQFAAFRAANVTLNPVIVLSPQLTQQPVVQENRLHLVGFFPSTPSRIGFDMWFEPSQNQWKMAQLNVSLTQAPAQQAAPRQPQPQQRPQGR